MISSPAVAQGKVIFGTSDSSLYLVLDAADRQASRQAAGQGLHVLVALGRRRLGLHRRPQRHAGGARSRSGELLWEFQTEASKRNAGWVLTADRKFNTPMLFRSSWREAPIVATTQQFGVGSIFSSPLVVGGVVYFGSTDGTSLRRGVGSRSLGPPHPLARRIVERLRRERRRAPLAEDLDLEPRVGASPSAAGT